MMHGNQQFVIQSTAIAADRYFNNINSDEGNLRSTAVNRTQSLGLGTQQISTRCRASTASPVFKAACVFRHSNKPPHISLERRGRNPSPPCLVMSGLQNVTFYTTARTPSPYIFLTVSVGIMKGRLTCI